MPGISYDGPYEDNKNLTMLLEDVLTALGITPGAGSNATKEMLLEAIANGVSGSGSSGGGSLAITETYDEATDTYTLNKTWQEIYDALAAGKYVYIFGTSSNGAYHSTVNEASSADSFYYVYTSRGNVPYTSESADGYPSVK